VRLCLCRSAVPVPIPCAVRLCRAARLSVPLCVACSSKRTGSTQTAQRAHRLTGSKRTGSQERAQGAQARRVALSVRLFRLGSAVRPCGCASPVPQSAQGAQARSARLTGSAIVPPVPVPISISRACPDSLCRLGSAVLLVAIRCAVPPVRPCRCPDSLCRAPVPSTHRLTGNAANGSARSRNGSQARRVALCRLGCACAMPLGCASPIRAHRLTGERG
jgi:hypothetical protein